MNVSNTNLTLITSALAALLSLINLFYNRRFKQNDTYRKYLENHINDLGQYLYESVALSNILLKTKGNEGFDNWKGKVEPVQKKLSEIRLKLRYALWGLDDPIKILTRLPDWTEHKWKAKEIDRGREMIECATRLRIHLDNTIRKSYINGTPPGIFARYKASKLTKQLKMLYYK